VKTSNEVKQALAIVVASKIEVTRQRMVIKRIPFAERTSEQQSQLAYWLRRASLNAKEAVRCQQLAYALVRGRAYWEQERTTRDPAKALAGKIAEAAGCEKVEVEAWLAAEPSEAARAAFTDHIEVARAVARQRSQERFQARRATVAA